jgi:hypothetical protein
MFQRSMLAVSRRTAARDRSRRGPARDLPSCAEIVDAIVRDARERWLHSAQRPRRACSAA